jgi:hypothetical protein
VVIFIVHTCIEGARMQKRDIVVSQHGPAFAIAENSGASRPEFYRLPKGGGGDPFFGFSRTFYYQGETRGYWKLVRIRERGRLRGVTLVPYDAVSAFVRSQMEEA